jgi:threonine/homoserine/homoserine lactone efflux protein
VENLLPVLSIVGVLAIGVVSPGPSFLFIAQRSAATSRLDGLAASVGMGIGGVVFALLALLGIHTVFQLLPWVFVVLKILGGAYLVFLAWKIWKGSRSTLTLLTDGEKVRPALGRSFTLGLVTQLSNPKTAVVYGSIFASLLPESFSWVFVLWLLPLVFLVECGWYSFVSLALSSSAPRRVYFGFKTIIDRSASVLMGLLGIKLIFSQGH